MPFSVTIEGQNYQEFTANLRAFADDFFGAKPAIAAENRVSGEVEEDRPRRAPKEPIVAREEPVDEALPVRGLSMFDTPAEKPVAKRGRPRKNVEVDEEAARHVADLQAAEKTNGASARTQLPGGQEVEAMYADAPDESDCRAALEQVMMTVGEEGVEQVMSSFGVERLRQVPPGKYAAFIAKCKETLKRAR